MLASSVALTGTDLLNGTGRDALEIFPNQYHNHAAASIESHARIYKILFLAEKKLANFAFVKFKPSVCAMHCLTSL